MKGRTPLATLTLPRLPIAPGQARRYLGPRLHDLGFSDDKSLEILVAVGEAVTNAVVHGGPDTHTRDADELRVRLEVRGSDLVIAVTSPRTGWRTLPPARSDPLARGGRGLLMIQNLTDAWRVEQGGGGTTVYLTWHLPRQLTRSGRTGRGRSHARARRSGRRAS
jgi:anti-sigma regulatory factor (Ser/Thr protein kinase)